MKINKVVFSLSLFFLMCKYTAIGQVQFGLYSYSESFYSPNESFTKVRTYETGYNKSNFSTQFGGYLSFKITNLLSISVGVQKIKRRFDCDCINVTRYRDNAYYISDSSCLFKLRSKYRIIQIPLSAKYLLSSQNKLVSHSIGVGNTIVYDLTRENLIYSSTGSITETYGRYFLSMWSPELYYDLDILLQKHLHANLSLGLRMEASNQSNYAFFGKVGVSYSFEKEKRKHKRR
jgi:hypothetical protein